jgi:uncharacterized membrane protein YkoI
MKAWLAALILLAAGVASVTALGISRDTDYDKLFQAATFSLTEAIDKALALQEAKDCVVVNAEIEEENGKIIYSIQLAKGTKILEANFDVRDGSLLPLENEEGDKSAQAKAAKITVKQAIEKADKRETGKAVEASLLMKDGKPVWEVKVYTAEKKLKTVSVNAETGELAGS